MLIDPCVGYDAIFVRPQFGVDCDTPLRVFEPEPRFLHGDWDAGNGFPIQPFIFFNKRRRVKPIDSVNFRNYIEHCFAVWGVGFHIFTPYLR